VTPAERQRIVDLYESGLTFEKIHEVTGRAIGTISKTLIRAGTPKRNGQERTGTAACEVCGKPVGYVPPSVVGKGKAARFCSSACMGVAKRLSETGDELLCHQCREVKPVGEFHTHGKTARGYQYWCKTCISEARRERRRKTPADPRVTRKYKLAEKGITPADYDRMYAEQQGRCAICKATGRPWEPGAGMKERSRILVVDHDHATGRVRALLCWNCNCGIGHFRENPDFMEAAIRYVVEQSFWAAA
jgi:Recombination endonuclease VII